MAKKRTPTRPRDMNQLAKRIVDMTTGQIEEDEGPSSNAVKRGIARAEALTPHERSEICRYPYLPNRLANRITSVRSADSSTRTFFTRR